MKLLFTIFFAIGMLSSTYAMEDNVAEINALRDRSIRALERWTKEDVEKLLTEMEKKFLRLMCRRETDADTEDRDGRN